ncbi:MAG: hypothetical protein ACYDBQ_09755 [Thermoplasmatota archaeon]
MPNSRPTLACAVLVVCLVGAADAAQPDPIFLPGTDPVGGSATFLNETPVVAFVQTSISEPGVYAWIGGIIERVADLSYFSSHYTGQIHYRTAVAANGGRIVVAVDRLDVDGVAVLVATRWPNATWQVEKLPALDAAAFHPIGQPCLLSELNWDCAAWQAGLSLALTANRTVVGVGGNESTVMERTPAGWVQRVTFDNSPFLQVRFEGGILHAALARDEGEWNLHQTSAWDAMEPSWQPSLRNGAPLPARAAALVLAPEHAPTVYVYAEGPNHSYVAADMEGKLAARDSTDSPLQLSNLGQPGFSCLNRIQDGDQPVSCVGRNVTLVTSVPARITGHYDSLRIGGETNETPILNSAGGLGGFSINASANHVDITGAEYGDINANLTLQGHDPQVYMWVGNGDRNTRLALHPTSSAHVTIEGQGEATIILPKGIPVRLSCLVHYGSLNDNGRITAFPVSGFYSGESRDYQTGEPRITIDCVNLRRLTILGGEAVTVEASPLPQLIAQDWAGPAPPVVHIDDYSSSSHPVTHPSPTNSLIIPLLFLLSMACQLRGIQAKARQR